MTPVAITPKLTLVQVYAIAKNTFKEAVRSRIFYILLAFALCLLLFSFIMGLLAIGSLRRVILDMGLATIAYFSAATAIFIGIGLIYKEVERKTIYNVLSKPLSRSSFILGRYLGIMTVLLVNLMAMTLVLAGVLVSVGAFTVRIFPAVGYIYLELMILSAVALFFSSVSSPVVSAICTVAFYLIGHTSSSIPSFLIPLVQSEFAKRALLLLYHLLPDLNLLGINNLVVHDIPTAPGFASRGIIYTLLMVAVLLLASSLCFKRRDLV